MACFSPAKAPLIQGGLAAKSITTWKIYGEMMPKKEKTAQELVTPIKRPGNQPFVVTEKDRLQVERMVGFGLTQEQISKIIGISENTLKKYFSDELEHGVSRVNSAVAQNLFSIATSREQGSVAAAIFWMKTRARWRETNHHVHSGDDKEPPIKIEGNLKGLSDAELDQMQNLLGKAAGKKE